jgi:hypothetical protein
MSKGKIYVLFFHADGLCCLDFGIPKFPYFAFIERDFRILKAFELYYYVFSH